MLVIVNPYATTVSERLKNLVVYALRGRYDVEAVETEARDHATELCREAARRAVRRGGGVRRRRHAERGRQRAGGVRHPAHLPPGRRHERLLPHARHPHRRRGRHRAPPADGGHLPAAPDGPGARQRPPLRLRVGGGARRERGRARGQPPAAQGPRGRVVLHLRGLHHLQPALPGAAPPRAGGVGRPDRGGRDRGRPELGPLHLLRPAPDPAVHGRGPSDRHDLRGGAHARKPGRHPHRRGDGSSRAAPTRWCATGGSTGSGPVSELQVSSRDGGPSRSRWTATTWASSTR